MCWPLPASRTNRSACCWCLPPPNCRATRQNRTRLRSHAEKAAHWRTRLAIADLTDHLRSPGYFTFVAACSVLGAQCLIVAGKLELAVTLWVIGLLAWVFFTYLIFTVLTVKEN